ncbi:tetratricopeptide repeat protein [Acidomonas methanolica]|uniref:Tetratricopeptide repeat family protein n=2 Tax=Acidomonas methanolica TaxID=437 RepID=A0A023D2Y0_ACIMT|nr:tetratricopeptide repeat protein [Acidomonas methanolica]GAJ28492.1 hypothetical protein Amme_027_043 [Acidomonas methanolica NBRC 104435]GEK99464.1 hypothetical protein AME01nite_19630 [Acidomonas methanolica NBRC 104435]
MILRLFRNRHAVFLTGVLLSAPVGISVAACFSGAAQAEDMLSANVGKPLQAAQSALAAKNYAKAMQDVDAADAVSGKTDYETYTIAQMRAAVAAQSGDTAAAIKAYDVLIASSRTPASAKQQMMMAEATMAYQAKDYARAVPLIEKYLKAAGPNPQMQTILVQSYYLQKDYKNAARVLQDQVNAEIKAKKVPPENQLQFLTTCYHAMKDDAGETHGYVLLAKYYSKPDYWAALIHVLATNAKLPEALQFNLLRLREATGTLKDPSDYMDIAERAMQRNMPQLAVKVMDSGYARGVLGKDAGAPREAKLKAMAVSRAADVKAGLTAAARSAASAPNAGPALTTGYNMVLAGQVQEGLALMKQGLAKHPRFPDIALLDYGMAEMDGGLPKDAAATFEQVQGEDGARDLAQLWELLITRPPAK